MLVEIINFFLSPLFSLFEPYFSRVTSAIASQKTQRAAVKSIFITGVAVVLVSIALVAYFGFYMIYVPKIAHEKPVYLQYDKENSPYAIVDFTENGRFDSMLTADQAYDILIDLDVPSSDRNIALGNFMIDLNLMAKNETVRSSSRPCILIYQSGLLRVIYTLWRLVPLVLGFTKEDQRLEVVMFENMIESAEMPITKALISISNSNLEVYSTKIRLDAHFRGLRYFMYYHSIPSAIIFTFMFLIWEILFSIIAWRLFVSWWQNKVPTHVTDPLRASITSGGTENIDDDNHQDDDSDRTRSEVEQHTIETESESEYESSRPGSVISPTIVSESGETSYGTESHLTDDNESQNFISKSLDDYDSSSVVETDDDIIDDDDQTEGSATPTKSPARSRKSTVSEVSTNRSDVEDGPSTSTAASTATSTARLQNNSKPYARRSNSSGGNNIK